MFCPPLFSETAYKVFQYIVQMKWIKNLIALGAVGLETNCILGSADERRSPSLLFCCHLLLGWQRQFTSRQKAKPGFDLTIFRRPSRSNHSTTTPLYLPATFCSITEKGKYSSVKWSNKAFPWQHNANADKTPIY